MEKLEKHIRVITAILAPTVIGLFAYILCRSQYTEILDCDNQKLKIVKEPEVEGNLLYSVRQQAKDALTLAECNILSDQFCLAGDRRAFVSNQLLCTIIERKIDDNKPSEAIIAVFDKTEISYMIFLGLIPLLLFFVILTGTEKIHQARKHFIAIGAIYLTGMFFFFLFITLGSRAFPEKLSNHFAVGATIFSITFYMAYNQSKKYLEGYAPDLPHDPWDMS